MTTRPAPHLRLVEGKPPPARPAQSGDVLAYTNRHGEHYYLHQGRTKTGKVRVFVARTVGEGALDAMPSGFEITESVNGVVSVRRVDPSRPKVPPADLETVRTEVARHEHLRRYVVEDRDGGIFICEPEGSRDEDALREMAAAMFVRVERMRAASIRGRPRFAPVMKFAPEPTSASHYVVSRMTYRVHGSWHILSAGPLGALAKRYVGHLGKESFFELL